MIFRQYHEILSGLKTETRRIHRPRMTVGKDYAMVPNRATPAWWFWERSNARCHPCPVQRITQPRDYLADAGDDMALTSTARINRYLAGTGAVQARIRILSIHQESLQSIDHLGAAAEGVETRHDYALLWEAINGPDSWRDNPDVWVIKFEVLPEVARLYALWQAQEGNDTGSGKSKARVQR